MLQLSTLIHLIPDLKDHFIIQVYIEISLRLKKVIVIENNKMIMKSKNKKHIYMETFKKEN